MITHDHPEGTRLIEAEENIYKTCVDEYMDVEIKEIFLFISDLKLCPMFEHQPLPAHSPPFFPSSSLYKYILVLTPLLLAAKVGFN